MRRLVVIGALLGLVVFPAPTMAAEPPNPTISISSVHYAGRGVIELDLTYSCSTPALRDYDWDPYLEVMVDQGRGRNERYAYYSLGLGPRSCDGQAHVRVLQLIAEEGAPVFRGGSATVWADLDACYVNNRTGEWVEKWAEAGGRFRVRHSG